MNLILKVTLIAILLNYPCSFAKLQITYDGVKPITHLLKDEDKIDMVKNGHRYYACFLQTGTYQVYSENEYITSFRINHHHLNHDIKFSMNEKKPKELKKSFPISLVVFLCLLGIFFGSLAYIWVKLFPVNEIEWYNENGDEI